MACELCASAGGRLVCRKGGYDGILCACGAMRIDPQPSHTAVDPTDEAHPAWFYGLSAPIKIAWLARTHPRGRMLEVGCGEGHFLEEAKRRGYDVAGVEAHPERARCVSRRLGIQVQAALIEDVKPAPDFDIVYHCDLLSHFPDPVRALEQMRACLRPDGVLFFETGLYGNIAPSWYERMPEDSFPRHRRMLSERNVRTLLSRCGFRVVRSKRYGLGPYLLAYDAAVSRGLQSRAAQLRNVFDSQASSGTEHTLVQRLHTFMRYRFGALTPGWGPQTMLVIAVQDMVNRQSER